MSLSGQKVLTNNPRDLVTLADDAAGIANASGLGNSSANPSVAIPYDFNGDAIADLAFQNFSGGTSTPQIWLWNGSSVTSQVTFPNPGPGWHIITSRDVNGDGKADLIWQNNDGTPGIWLMNGTTPIAEVGLSNPGTNWHLVASGDLNDDGKADLIWQDNSGQLGIWLMNGTTPTTEFSLADTFNPGPGPWKVVDSADFNRDGQDDILMQNTNTGELLLFASGGTLRFPVDPSWHSVSVAVFNGKPEIAWQNSDGTPGIWLMPGTISSPTAEAALPNPGPGWQLISIGHFTADGNADLLWQNISGAMGLWELNGTNVVAETNLPNPGAGWQSVNGHPITLAG